jgi:hypothetical protein
MTDSNGNLSVDFLVGFTIFMVAFIWVATLVPNLLLGVSAHGVDFDAVAYRTGVILAEDPGQTIIKDVEIPTAWEFERDTGKDNILRFGLAVSKDTPNVLSDTKVRRFFCSTAFSYPDDYHQKVIFGDYPYRFNISLNEVGESSGTRYVGDVMPGSNYGYIRREVKVKHFGDTLINRSDIGDLQLYNTGKDSNVSLHDFSIIINTNRLLTGNITESVTNPTFAAAYQIDPRTDWINISIVDMDLTPPRAAWLSHPTVSGPPTINLSSVTFSQGIYGEPGLYPLAPGRVPHVNFTYDDGNMTPVTPPVNLTRSVNLSFQPGFFTAADVRGAIYINLTFGTSVQVCPPSAGCSYQGMPFLNTSKSGPWDYNYNPANVTQPYLRDAVLEVAVW